MGVAEGLDLVVISDDEVLVQFGTRSHPSELLRDSDVTGILGKLIARLLGGPAKVSELLSELGAEQQAEAQILIESLLQCGFLTDIRTDPTEQYLSYTFSGKSRLTECSVSLIGNGPIGARVAHSLLQHGIRRLTLLDERKANSLWHSLFPTISEGGRADERPVQAILRDRLLAAGYSDVEALDRKLDAAGVESAVNQSDLTVVALEQPDLRLAHLVNRFCLRDRKPWLLAGIDGNLGLIGPLFLPLHTACYNDYRVLADAATPSPAMARKHRQHILGRAVGSFFPGLPAYAEIVAGYASLATIHFLLRDTCFALGRVLTIDFERMLIDVEDVLKLPRCPVCAAERSAYQPAFSAEVVTRSLRTNSNS